MLIEAGSEACASHNAEGRVCSLQWPSHHIAAGHFHYILFPVMHNRLHNISCEQTETQR
jgi:hypothetical protein